MTDHLYFGDLGGQAFRVDFNNKSKTQDEFVKRVVTLFSEHKTGGKSPRFYEMPSVSIHLEDSAYFGAVAFSSGNRSSPLAADANSAQDGVFVVFDNDVARSNLLGSISLNTEKESLKLLTLKSGVPRRDAAGKFNGGWKYLYSGTGRYKGLVLLGGEPGIGKSTLVLQTVLRMHGKRILYVSGEESARQIKLRADRLMNGAEATGSLSGKFPVED